MLAPLALAALLAQGPATPPPQQPRAVAAAAAREADKAAGQAAADAADAAEENAPAKGPTLAGISEEQRQRVLVRMPPPRRPGVLALRWENDVVAGSDENYSNGISLTLSREEAGPIGGVWKWFGLPGGRKISSYEIGQMIITPKDIRTPDPDPNDRPYAGMLYAGLSTQVVNGNRFDGLKLVAGVVGPASLAAEAQKAFHRLIGSPEPRGWGKQLKNEPILNVVYEHRHRFTLADSRTGWGADAIPTGGGMFGNVLIQAQANLQLRAGFNLPDNFGSTLMRGLGNLPFPESAGRRAPRRFGAYVFAGGGGTLVARNLSIDGNTFRDGPRVDKLPAFAAGELGVSALTPWFQATLSYVVWGREYETQPRASRFGAATIGFRF